MRSSRSKTFEIPNPIGIKTLSRLRLEFSLPEEHKFECNLREINS